jgi:hypothetical protein
VIKAAVLEASVLGFVVVAVEPLMMFVPLTVILVTEVGLLPENVMVEFGLGDSGRLHSL